MGSSKDNIPLMVIYKKILEHKVVSIISLVVIVASIIGYHSIKIYQEKKAAKEFIHKEIKHFLDIAGTYKSENIYEEKELHLLPDGTAMLTTQNNYHHSGYWREIAENYPIEIEFSNSFGITLGCKRESY